ncbi:glycosyltransferase [Nioella nitratireducens]|uniref:glycosyltransferase n=1 Tax=Nioella nitratireducens TaxID=1287720 RepID=UPI001314D6D8|nr:galactosyltransferase-related protein [Nioella nitratireducens]
MEAVQGKCTDAACRLGSLRKIVANENSDVSRSAYRHFAQLISNHVALNQEMLDLPTKATGVPDEGEERLLGGILPGGDKGVSLVTCAMNRTENLLKALMSWLAHPQIKEIVIVDWGSKVPVSKSLSDGGFFDPRIRVIRIDDEPRWVLSYAFNIGFRSARYERILKADADIVLSDSFFGHNLLPDAETFVAGNWRTAASDQVHVNGFFYTSRSALAAVGGFNEYITTYGWDDDDLYTRLEAAGFARQDVAPDTIHHLHHSDEHRTGEGGDDLRPARDVIQGTPRYMIQRNRLLCDMMPGWNNRKQLLPLRIISESPGRTTLTRAGGHEAIVPDAVFAAASRQMLQVLMSWDYGPEVRDLDHDTFDRVMQRPVEQLSKQAFLEARDNPASLLQQAPMVSSPRKKVFIDAQHGLGNRLRAIGSAAAIAQATGRELVIVWEPDDHCDCQFSDLFDYQGAVVHHRFADEAENLGCDVYNYMTAETGAQKDAPIVPRDRRSIYARAAFVLNSEHSNWDTENRFIQSLRPVEFIRDLVAGVRNPNDVSAHIRMEGGKQYEHLPYESAGNWTQEDHEAIAEWREKSHFAHFMARLDKLTEDGKADRIFIAADLPATYQEFLARYGDRVAYLPRTAYDRSSEQLRYAMADAILLSRAPLLLGSTWSSFSELATRLAPNGITVEMSGKDF